MTIEATPCTIGLDGTGLHFSEFIARIAGSSVATEALAAESADFYRNYAFPDEVLGSPIRFLPSSLRCSS